MSDETEQQHTSGNGFEQKPFSELRALFAQYCQTDEHPSYCSKLTTSLLNIAPAETRDSSAVAKEILSAPNPVKQSDFLGTLFAPYSRRTYQNETKPALTALKNFQQISADEADHLKWYVGTPQCNPPKACSEMATLLNKFRQQLVDPESQDHAARKQNARDYAEMHSRIGGSN